MSRRPLTHAEFLARLRAACAGAGGQRAWGRQNGVSASHVSQVLAGDKAVTDTIACRLGLAGETIWRPIDGGRP